MKTLTELNKAVKEVLFANPKEKAKYENKKPTKAEQNKKWRLERVR